MKTAKFTKRNIVGAVASIALSTGIPASSFAQAAPPADAAKTVPVTKMLAIGTLTAKASPEAIGPIMKSEVPATVRLYLAGKIDQWYAKHDRTGVVFILNVTDVAEAHAMLEALPLGKAGMMTFELMPLGPLQPLGRLLPDAHP